MATEKSAVSAIKRRKIFLLYPYYWPFYKAGGPVQSLFNIASTFRDDCDFFLLALNRDIHAGQATVSLRTGEWTMGPNGERIYFVTVITPLLILRLIRHVNPDAIFVNGIFNVETTLPGLLWGRVLKKKVIISPRGMLQEWGLNRNRLIKKIFLMVVKMVLRKEDCWHATDEKEVQDIRRVFGQSQLIHVAANIPRKVSSFNGLPFPAANGKIRLVFLSLINPNKNLHLIIDAVNALSSDFTLDIFGPVIDKDYWAICQSKMVNRDLVQYKGPVPPWEVPSLLTGYHFFVLPTQGENFGHAIFDALASGVPVIISRNTPWKGIEEKNAGFYIDLEADTSMADALKKVLAMSNDLYKKFRTESLSYASDYWKNKDYETEYGFLINSNSLPLNR